MWWQPSEPEPETRPRPTLGMPIGRTCILIRSKRAPTSQAFVPNADKSVMSSEITIRVPARLQMLAATAMLLEKLERLPRSASAAQYQGVVRQLQQLLDEAEDDPGLESLLRQLPALAELHENRHYAQAGLCRTPLDVAIVAEQEARQLLQRLHS